MITSSVFNILEIDETRDETLIKNAYRTKLHTVNPEDNPEGFVQLREAYEEALRLAKETETAEWAMDTQVGQWTQQISDIYTNFDKRTDIECWRKLFEESFFQDFDTEDEAKKALISYLTRHYYLPKAIWVLIDDSCEIETKKEEYTESFPSDFLAFVLDSTKNSLSIPLHLFSGPPGSEYDSYIQTYFSLRNKITAEDSSGAEALIDELAASGIAHPYLLVERIRYAVKLNDTISVRKWIEEYKNTWSSCLDEYVLYSLELAYWALGDFDTAFQYAEQVLAASPEHFGSQKVMCDYYSEMKQYEKSHDAYIQLMEANPYSTDFSISFQKNLQCLIEQRKQKISENPVANEIIELSWNYYQASEYQKALDALLSVTPETEEDAYSYTNLIGRLYSLLEKYETALPHLLKWKDYIDAAIDDHSEESQRRLNRKGTVHFFIALVWCSRAEISKDEADYTTALSFFDVAIEFESSPRNLEYISRRAALLLAAGRNEECIDYCTGQIALTGNFVSLFLNRQQASYNLKLVQDVISDFHSIVRITPGFLKPYVLTADVYLKIGQYKESLRIIDQAYEANLESPKLRLIAATDRRLDATDRQVTEGCITALKNLDEECRIMDPKDCDIEDLDDIRLQICYAHMDLTQYKSARAVIESLISGAPDNAIFVRVLSDIFAQCNLLFDAEVTLTVYLKKYPNTLLLLISLGDVYTKAGKYDLAIETYEKILALDPSHELPYIMMSKIYLKKNMYSSKAEYLARALETANKQISISSDAENVFQRGNTYLDIGDMNSAIEDFKKALDADPRNARVFYGFIGDAYKFQRIFDTALENYLQAYELTAETYNFYSCKDLSVCYESMHRYAEALEMLDVIIKNQPKLIEAYNDKARIYIKMREYPKAMDAYMIALRNADSADLRARAYSNMYTCNLLMNNKSAAWSIIINSVFSRESNAIYCKTTGDYFLHVKKSPPKAIMHYTKGYNLCKAGSGTWEAEKIFSVRFLEIYHAKKWKMDITRQRAQFFKALYARFGDLNGYLDHPHEHKFRCFSVGCILYYAGEIERAREVFDQMDTGKNCNFCTYSKCVESIAGHAMLLEAAGQIREAISCYEEVIAEGYACERYIPHIQKLKKKAKIKS